MNINFTGYICDTSYGMAAMNVIKSLTELKHKVSVFSANPIQGDIPQQFHDSLRAGLENAKFFDPDAPSVRMGHQFDLAQHVGRGKRIGWPIFELDKFNDLELHHLKSQDELIVCSQWAREICIDNRINIPINVVPLGVDSTIFSPARLSRSGKTVFINVGKKELRKGHDVILKCFNRAFTEDDNVELWMVWGNRILDNSYPAESKAWTDMYENSKLGKKIVLHEWQNSQRDIANLFNRADCGLFPSCAEGFNLDLLEAMACGLPVITTYYSAHTEFANGENAYLVMPSELESAYDGIWFMGQGQWMKITDSLQDGIVQLMKTTHERKQRGEDLFNKHGVETAKQFSWINSSKKLVETLQ